MIGSLSQSFFSIDLASPSKDIDGELLVIVRRVRKWFADRLLEWHPWMAEVQNTS